MARGVAWATPTVALGISAPALAASCTPRTFTTDLPGGYTWDGPRSATSRTVDQTTADEVTVTISVVPNSGTTLLNQNLTTTTANIGRAQRTAIAFTSQPSSTSGQTVTFGFSRPVTGLTFLLIDIDQNPTTTTADRWRDRVVLSGAPSAVVGSNVATSATTTTRTVQATSSSTSLPTTSSAGNARLTYAGTISSFTMTYSSSSGTAGQLLYMSSMQFTPAGCAGTA